MFCKAKFLLVNLLLAVLCFQNLYAYDFESDGVYYNIIDNVLKQVEVTHSGNPQNNQYQSGTYYLPDVVRYEDVENHVTSIGDSAFFSCRVWFSVNLPQSVTRIGNAAFQGSMLQSVNIPESVTSIGNGAFFNCSGLQYVDISSGITSIGDSTFFSCSGLMSVNIPESVTSIGNAAFQYCI